MDLVPLYPNLIYTTEDILTTLTARPWWNFFQQPFFKPNLDKTFAKWTIPCGFYKYIYWSFLLLPVLKLMQTKINRVKLVWLNWIHPIHWWWKVKPHNRHPCHDLTQTCGGNKDVCLIWIRPTEKLLTYPGTCFSINEFWFIKYNKHKSKINKRRLERRTWRIF